MNGEEELHERKFHVVGQSRDDLEKALSTLFHVLNTNYVYHYCEVHEGELVLFWTVQYGLQGKIQRYYYRDDVPKRKLYGSLTAFDVTYSDGPDVYASHRLCTIRPFENPLSVGPASVFVWEWLLDRDYQDPPSQATLFPKPKEGFEIGSEKEDGFFSDGNHGMLCYVRPVWVS